MLATAVQLQNLLVSNTGVLSASATVLDQLLQAADKAVKDYCKQAFERNTYTEFRCGNGTPDLPLYQKPVISITSLNLDPGGFYGKGTNAFASGTLLTEGQSYVCKYDQPDGSSSSGIITRLGGGPGQISLGDWFGNFSGWARGTLTARMPPVWPMGVGNIKIVYVAGYVAGSVPADLSQAVCQLAVYLYRSRKFGGVAEQQEELGDYNYQLATGLIGTAPELGTIRQLLSRYRDAQI